MKGRARGIRLPLPFPLNLWVSCPAQQRPSLTRGSDLGWKLVPRLLAAPRPSDRAASPFAGQGDPGRLPSLVCTAAAGLSLVPTHHPHPSRARHPLPQGTARTGACGVVGGQETSGLSQQGWAGDGQGTGRGRGAAGTLLLLPQGLVPAQQIYFFRLRCRSVDKLLTKWVELRLGSESVGRFAQMQLHTAIKSCVASRCLPCTPASSTCIPCLSLGVPRSHGSDTISLFVPTRSQVHHS